MYWVELYTRGKRVPFPTIDKARKEAIQMILKSKPYERQANIYTTKTGYETSKGATTFVGSVVNYSGTFRWIHYVYKVGITLSLSDVLDYDGKVVMKDPRTAEYSRYGKPKKIKRDW